MYRPRIRLYAMETFTIQPCVLHISETMNRLRLDTRMAREEREAGAMMPEATASNTKAEFSCPMYWLPEGLMAPTKAIANMKQRKKSNNCQTIFSYKNSHLTAPSQDGLTTHPTPTNSGFRLVGSNQSWLGNFPTDPIWGSSWLSWLEGHPAVRKR